MNERFIGLESVLKLTTRVLIGALGVLSIKRAIKP